MILSQSLVSHLHTGSAYIYVSSSQLSPELQTSISNCLLLSFSTWRSNGHLKFITSKTELQILYPSSRSNFPHFRQHRSPSCSRQNSTAILHSLLPHIPHPEAISSPVTSTFNNIAPDITIFHIPPSTTLVDNSVSLYTRLLAMSPVSLFILYSCLII